MASWENPSDTARNKQKVRNYPGQGSKPKKKRRSGADDRKKISKTKGTREKKGNPGSRVSGERKRQIGVGGRRGDVG